jgi:hypothetical protein
MWRHNMAILLLLKETVNPALFCAAPTGRPVRWDRVQPIPRMWKPVST